MERVEQKGLIVCMEELEYYGIVEVQDKGIRGQGRKGEGVVISRRNQMTMNCKVLLKVDLRELCSEVDNHDLIRSTRIINRHNQVKEKQ